MTQYFSTELQDSALLGRTFSVSSLLNEEYHMVFHYQAEPFKAQDDGQNPFSRSVFEKQDFVVQHYWTEPLPLCILVYRTFHDSELLVRTFVGSELSVEAFRRLGLSYRTVNWFCTCYRTKNSSANLIFLFSDHDLKNSENVKTDRDLH